MIWKNSYLQGTSMQMHKEKRNAIILQQFHKQSLDLSDLFQLRKVLPLLASICRDFYELLSDQTVNLKYDKLVK